MKRIRGEIKVFEERNYYRELVQVFFPMESKFLKKKRYCPS